LSRYRGYNGFCERVKMDKFKEWVDMVLSNGEWLVVKLVVFFCLVYEGARYVRWVINHK
jgi:hypothetical protein